MNKLRLVQYKGDYDNYKGVLIDVLLNNDYVYYKALEESKDSIKKVLTLEIKGKNYNEKADYLRNLAIEFQMFEYDTKICFTMSEICDICSWFEQKAKRFGLVKEFKENGII